MDYNISGMGTWRLVAHKALEGCETLFKTSAEPCLFPILSLTLRADMTYWSCFFVVMLHLGQCRNSNAHIDIKT